MALVVETSSPAAADPAVVWNLLYDTTSWRTWWKDLLSVRILDHKPLREGSPLELLVQPRQMKLTLHPTVDLLTEGRTLSLTHWRSLLRGTVAWQIAPHDLGVKISARGVFKGPLTVGNTWFHQEDALRMTLHRSVRGLKKASELAS